MNQNDGSGCLAALLGGLLLAMLVAFAVGSTGLPNVTGDALTWNTTATSEREQTKRHEITEENETERDRIASDERTSIEWAVTLRWLGGFAAVGVGVWAWSRRPHKPVPPTVTMLLPHYPGHVAELIDGEWCVVDPNTGLYYTEADARHILIANGLGE